MRTKTTLLVMAIFTSISCNAINYFWVGGSGSWSDLSHWSLSPGGGIFHSQVPQSTDNVFFDANSFTASGQTVTVDQTIVQCADMNWTGVTHTPVFSGDYSNTLRIYGSLSLAAGMTNNFNGQISMETTIGGQTITTAGQILNNTLIFNGIGGEWILQDALTLSDYSSLFFYNGTLNTNNQTVTVFSFEAYSSSTLTLGSSTLNFSNLWYIHPASTVTINAGTSTIRGADIIGYSPRFLGGGLAYHDVFFNGSGQIHDNNTFHDVTFSKNGTIFGSNTYDNLNFLPGYTYILPAGLTQTITTSLNVNGNCGALIGIVKSSTLDVQASIAKASGNVTVSYVTLKDINATGGATFTANNSLDLGNNTGWAINPLPSKNLYWVGNAGNWGDGNHWSTISGGNPSGCSPTPVDNVFFDPNSFSLAGQTVTINVPTAYCNNMTWSGISNVPTLYGDYSGILKIYGSLTLATGMNFNYIGPISFEATTGGKTITTSGNVINSSLTFNGIGGEWILQDALTLNNNGYIYLNNGTLNSNNQTVTANSFASYTSSARTLIMGSSTFNLSGDYTWSIQNSSGMTLNAGTSTINSTTNGILSHFGSDGLTYHDVFFASGATLSGNNNFHDLTISKNGTINGSNTFDNLIFSPGYTYILPAGLTQTINTSLNVNGNCGALIGLIKSSDIGSQATISKASGIVTVSYATLKDINATGGATFIANNAIDLGNNTGWTINAMPSKNLYWIGNGGNWGDGSHWSANSGGAPSGCSPTAVDNVFFDANSFSLSGQTVTVNVPNFYFNNMNWTGVTNTPTLYGDYSSIMKIFGSLTLTNGMNFNYSGPVNFEATTTGQTISTAGKVINAPLNFNGIGGEWTLQSELTAPNTISLNNGSLNTNNQIVNAYAFESSTSFTRSLTMGSSTFNLSSSYIWIVQGSGMTLNAGTSTIVGADPNGNESNFYGGGLTYNDAFFAGDAKIVQSNIFHTVTIEKNGIIQGGNTFDNLIFSPGYTYTLPAGQTQTVNNICAQGNGALPIRIQSNVAGTPATISKASGTICWDYVRVSDISTTGGATFNAGLAPTNSQDMGGNTGLLFTGGCTPVSCPCTSPSITSQPVNKSVCAGNMAVFEINAFGTGLTYQWQVDQGTGFTNLNNTAPYSGVTSKTLNITSATTGMSSYQYRCVLTGTCAPISTSNAAMLTVNQSPIITVNSATICSGETATLTASGAASYFWLGGGGSNTNSITVSPILTTSYMVMGMTGSCSGMAFATVTVNPLPMVTANSVTINSGQTATLTASGATNYVWSIGGMMGDTTNPISVSPATTTTYTVTGTTNGCSNTAIATVTVNTAPPEPTEPEVTITPEGLFDNVFDKDGHKYELKNLIAGGDGSNPTPSVLICSPGYFRVYADPGSGMEGTSPVETARRDVICQVLNDISAFIPMPSGSTAQVNLWVRNIVDLTSSSSVLGVASAFYTIPALSNNPIPGGIADNEVFKTIVSGIDSYTNVAAPLIIANNPPGVAAFYHGVMGFNFNNFNWETNLSAPSTTNNDLYTVALHEITHALGIVSFIDHTGASILGAGFPYYTSYDNFLTTLSGTQLIVPNNSNCSLYNFNFNQALNTSIPHPLHPGCTLVPPTNSSFVNHTVCANRLLYSGSITLPIYTPSCFEPGSSFSHLEDECFLNPGTGQNYGNDSYFTMSNATPTATFKRFLQPEERQVLCDLGYRVGSSFGGTGGTIITNLPHSYGTGTLCPGRDVVGINDGLLSGGAYQFISTVGGTLPINFSTILINDVEIGTSFAHPANFECLEVISGNGTVSATSGTSTTTINFNAPTTAGVILLRYIPVSHSGQRGNITYIYIYNMGAFSCTPNACNLVPNGDFEQHPGGIPNAFNQLNRTCGWGNAITGGSCDYFHTQFGANPANVPCNASGAENDNLGLHAYAGFVTQGLTGTNEVIFTRLSSPLAPNTTYQLTLDASLAEKYSTNGFPLGVCFVQNYTPSAGFFITTNASNMFVPAPPPITNYDGWTPVTINFTTGNNPGVDFGQDFIIIGNIIPGNLQNGALIPLAPPAPLSNLGCTYTVPTASSLSYLYIDNVVLQPASLAATFTPPSTVCLNQTLDLNNFVSIDGGSFTGPGVSGNTFTAATAGVGTHTLTYTYTNNLGCIMHVGAVVTVVSTSIALSVSPPAPSTCAGQPVTLTVSGATSYTWQPGSLSGSIISVSPFSTTTYTVIATNASGCSTVTVTVNQTPVVTATPTSQNICSGSSTSITLTNSLSGTTSWTVVQTGVTGATSGSGTSIAQALTNTGTAPGTAVYTITPTANGCTGVPINVTITVNPSPNVSVNSLTICTGQTAILTATGAANYTWSTGATVNSISVSPTATTSFTVTSISNGCSKSVVATVTVNQSPIITLSALPTICTSENLNLTAYVSPFGGTFTGTGTTPSGIFNSAIAGNSAIIYSYQGSNGCISNVTINVTVSGNCCIGTSGITVPSTGANSLSIGANFPATPGTIAINGNFTINNTFTITNRKLLFAPNVKIIVLSGAQLTINKSTLYSCSTMMWDGIEIQPGGMLVIQNTSLIEDAKIAVYSNNTGGTTATIANFRIEDKVVFNRNYIGVKVFNYTLSTLHPGIIRNCTFRSNASTITGNGNTPKLDSPYSNQSAEIGVELNNVNSIQIGDPSLTTYKNYFGYLRTGIRAQNSIYNVYNNDFNSNFPTPPPCNIQQGGQPCPPIGWAIWNTNTACIIGGYSTFQPNSFQNLSNGILHEKGWFLNVRKNTFKNITSGLLVNSVAINTNGFIGGATVNISDNTFLKIETGLSHRNNNNTTYNIYANTFENFTMAGINAVQNTLGSINVISGGPNALPNTFVQNITSNNDIAINVSNAGLPLASSPTIVNINNNTIKKVSKGISLTNIKAPQVKNNSIILKHTNGNYYGITSRSCYNEKIYQNSILKALPVPTAAFENQVYGISIESNIGLANVSENTTTRCGTGLRFRSYSTANTTVKCNKMQNNWAGLTLDAVNIGQQGKSAIASPPNGIANDNQWTTIPNNMTGSVSVRGKNGYTQVKFYTRSAGYSWCPLVNNVQPGSTILTVNSFPPLIGGLVASAPQSCSNICYTPPCTHAMLAKIARNQSPFSTVAGTARFTMQEAVLRSVGADSIPPDITTTDGHDLQAFIDTTLINTNVGKLITVSNKYASGDTMGAIALNNSIIPIECADEYHKTVNSIFFTTWGIGNFYFSSVDSTILYDIAVQDPLLCGTAIYDARVMLGIDINDYSMDGTKMLAIPIEEGVITDKVGILYPNPAQNKCTYEATLSETESGMIMMYDLNGRFISSYKLDSGYNQLNLDLSQYSNGIYLYKIYINGVVVDYKKLVITK